MIVTNLSENWRLCDVAPGTANPAVFSAPGLDTSAWLPAPVPGDVNAVLVAAGRMPSPHRGDQAREC